MYTKSKSANRIQSHTERFSNYKQITPRNFNYNNVVKPFETIRNDNQKATLRRKKHRHNSQRLFTNISNKTPSKIYNSTSNLQNKFIKSLSNNFHSHRTYSATPKTERMSAQISETLIDDNNKIRSPKQNFHKMMITNSLQLANELTNPHLNNTNSFEFSNNDYSVRKQNIINQLSKEANSIVMSIKNKPTYCEGKKQYQQFEVNQIKGWHLLKKRGKMQTPFRVDLSMSMKSYKSKPKIEQKIVIQEKNQQQNFGFDQQQQKKSSVNKNNQKSKQMATIKQIQKYQQQRIFKKSQREKRKLQQYKLQSVAIYSQKVPIKIEQNKQNKYQSTLKVPLNKKQLKILIPDSEHIQNQPELSVLLTDNKQQSIYQKNIHKKLLQPPTITKQLEYSKSDMSVQHIVFDNIPTLENYTPFKIQQQSHIVQHQIGQNISPIAKYEHIKGDDLSIQKFTLQKPIAVEQKNISQVVNEVNEPTLQQQRQYLNSVGQIVGLGLKMMKDININWIIPCLPIYQKFYQLRCQIIEKAKQSNKKQLINSMTTQNQSISKSFQKMLKSCMKKKLDPSKLVKLKAIKINNPVSLDQIIDQIEQYVDIVNDFQQSDQQQHTIKKHMLLIINSVIKLINLQITNQIQFLNPEIVNVNTEIQKGLSRIYNYTQ